MPMPVRVKKTPNKVPRSSATGRILGAKAFAAITAVEGLKLSAAGKKRIETSKRRKMSYDERRAEIVRAYIPAKGHR
jgi:hypothetical protein